MRSYLSLINIFASKQKRQNSLTIICIVIAVALVTTIFGIADMGIKSKKYSIINTKGNYHIFFSTINKKQINMIKARPEIKVTGDLDIYRASSDDDTSSTNGKGTNTVKYKISGEETNILGVSSDIIKQKMLPIKLIKGRFADNDNEVMLSEQTRVELGASIGDKLEINTANNMTKKVCVVGFVKSDLDLKSEKENLIILNSNFFEKVIEEADYSSSELVLFSKYANIKDVVKDIVKQMNLKENQVKQNTSLLDIIGQSDENYVEKIYLQLIVLATLVSIAGIFMISSTLNTKITQRIKFFGMLNSLGATKKQIKRFVHLEALNWCKVGITVGVLVGVVTVWILYAILHYFVPSYFNDIVGFGISPISIVIGAVIGIVTVYFSSLAPARRAAKISAMEALRGSTIYKKTSLNKRNLKNTGFTSIENVLGMHHAKSSKKNFMLVVCSFSISIVLFITLSSITNSISKLNQTYKPWNQDILINTSFDKNMREKLVNFLKSNDKIKTFSQNFERDIEADRNGKKEKIELSVFDENYFEWAKSALVDGKIDESKTKNDKVLIYQMLKREDEFKVGDKITIKYGNKSKIVTVEGIVSGYKLNSYTAGKDAIVCNQKSFEDFIGKDNAEYSWLSIKLNRNATDEDISKIRDLVGKQPENFFFDYRDENLDTLGMVLAINLLSYGLLTVFIIITSLNIINTISMSVSSRELEYKGMKAIGMTNKQIVKMVKSEAMTYFLVSIVVGVLFGVPFEYYSSSVIFKGLELHWKIPIYPIIIIISLMLVSTVVSIKLAKRKIKQISANPNF